MFKANMLAAQCALECGEPKEALTYLRHALNVAAKGTEWSYTMKAIRFTLKAINS